MDDVEVAQYILEGKCPVCKHVLPRHSIVCDTEAYDRLLRLKNTVAKYKLVEQMKNIEDKKKND